MERTEIDLVKIGDYVKISGDLYDMPRDIYGTVVNVFTHHIRIKSESGLHYSLNKLDSQYLTVIRKSNFASYGSESFKTDIEKASN